MEKQYALGLQIALGPCEELWFCYIHTSSKARTELQATSKRIYHTWEGE